MKNKQNKQTAKNCGNKNCGNKNAQKQNNVNNKFEHGGNND